MIFEEAKLLKLKDLFDEIKKSRHDTIPIVKSDTPVKGYEKNVGGQQVHVRSYQQSRKDATAPIIDVPGPKAHLSKQADSNEHGGGIKPTVPANKKVSCPMCNKNVGTKTPEQGEKEIFQYMPPKNPFEGKEQDEISLDDVAQGIHRTPLIGHDEFKAMSEPEKQKHLKNHAFIHLTPEAKTALHREIKKIVRPRFESVGHWMQLHRLGTQYDPETLVDDFAHRIIDEMTRHRRANSKFGYKKEEELQQNPPPGGMPQLQYHKGMDTQNVSSDKDLAREARVRTPWWAKRFFFKEAGGKGFENLIGGEKGPAFQQSQLMGKIYKADRKIDELKKQAGLATSDTKIDTSIPYSLQDLQQTAKKAGYMLEKETAPDGSLKRVLLFEEDPSVLQTIGEDPKYATPKLEVDFDKGGKINDVRDKLASLVNPVEGGTNTPLHNYIQLHDQLNEGKDKVKELHKQTDILKEKYERFNEDPKIHRDRIEDIAANSVLDPLQSLKDKVDAKGSEQLDQIAYGVVSLKEFLDDGDFKDVMSELGRMKSAANSIKVSSALAPYVKNVLQGIISLTKEAEAYRDKKMISPDERQSKLDKMFDAYKDSEEELNNRNAKLEQLSSGLAEFKDDPQVKAYSELHDKKEQLRQQLETIQPAAEKHWQESLGKLNPEGDEETGDYSDDAQVKKWKEAQKYTPGDESTDWDEKIPEDVDLENEEQTAGVGNNILDALKDKLHGHEHFIFGGEGHKKGLIHIAHNMLWKLYTSGDMTHKIEELLQQHPKDGPAPDFYKENKVLHGQNRWRRLHDIDPSIAAKYATLFSDYNPVPYAETDMYDEKHAGLFKDLFEDLKEKGYSLPKDPKTAQWQYYQLFRLLGNHMIGGLIKNKHGQSEIFDKIRSLNKPHTATGDDSSRYPGKLRRTLERRMDALYGRYAKKFPTSWPHNYDKPLETWLKKIGVKPEEEDYGKSLIVLSDKLLKADYYRLVVNRK